MSMHKQMMQHHNASQSQQQYQHSLPQKQPHVQSHSQSMQVLPTQQSQTAHSSRQGSRHNTLNRSSNATPRESGDCNNSSQQIVSIDQANLDVNNTAFLLNQKLAIVVNHQQAKEDSRILNSRTGTPVAASHANSTQNLHSLAAFGFTKRRVTEARGSSVNSARTGPVLPKKRLIKKKEHKGGEEPLIIKQNSVNVSPTRQGSSSRPSSAKGHHGQNQISSSKVKKQQSQTPSESQRACDLKQVRQLITEEMIEAKRIKMKPVNSTNISKVVHLQKAQSSRQTPVLSRACSSDKFVGVKSLKSTKNVRISASSVNLNQVKPRKTTKTSSNYSITQNLQINPGRQGKSYHEVIPSKASSNQSTARNIPKGSITFHNKDLLMKEKSAIVNNTADHINLPQQFDSKKRKEHPSFFDATLNPQSQILDETHNIQYSNYINKAPLPKHQPQVSQLSLRQQNDSSHSQTQLLSQITQNNKQLTSTLTGLFNELKSLFFYEESATLRDQLRQIVQKYEEKAQEFIAFNSNDNSNSVTQAQQNHNHAFSLRSFNELPTSKRSSLDKGIIQVDQQNERLRAFINRHEQRQESPPKLACGRIILKDDSQGRRQKVEAFEIKQDQEDCEETDLKTSIESIDQRLNALIGQTNLMFGGRRRTETQSSSQSPQRDLQLQPTAATSAAGAATVQTTINSQGGKQQDLFQTMQTQVNSNAADHLRFSHESSKNIGSASQSSNRRVSPYLANTPQQFAIQDVQDAILSIRQPQNSYDPHKRSQSATSNRNKRKGSSSPISTLQKALLQIGQQSQSYEVKHTFVKHFTARLQLLEELAYKYQSEVPMLYHKKQRSRQPKPVGKAEGVESHQRQSKQTLGSGTTGQSILSSQPNLQPEEAFETSEKDGIFKPPQIRTQPSETAPTQRLIIPSEQQSQLIKELEEREAKLAVQEKDLLASKEKVFAKWQEYIEKNDKLDEKDKEVSEKLETLKVKESEIEAKMEQLDLKEKKLIQIQAQQNNSSDEIHSVFFVSEKEAQIKQKEVMLEQRQKELEQRADEINRILKSFNNSSTAQNTLQPASPDELPLQSVCKLRQSDEKPLRTLLAPQTSSNENNTTENSEKTSPRLNEEEAKGAKYESPKFYVGSGSPTARKSHQQEQIKLANQEEEKEVPAISRNQMQNGNFSFQQRQQPTDQSQDEEDRLNDTLASDYPDNFAEEFRLKQQKMFEEFNEVRNEKQKLNKLIKGLSVQDPDEVGTLDGAHSKEDSSPKSTAINMVVETPTSLANDSQLHQLISQMQQMRDVLDSDDETELTILRDSKLQQNESNTIQMEDASNYRDIGEQDMQAQQKPKIDILEQLKNHKYNKEEMEDAQPNDNVLGSQTQSKTSSKRLNTHNSL